MQTSVRMGNLQRERSSLQRKGRTIKYDQMISLILSHSHGAVLTKQAKTKRTTAGVTKASDVERGMVRLQLCCSSEANNGMITARATGGMTARTTKRE